MAEREEKKSGHKGMMIAAAGVAAAAAGIAAVAVVRGSSGPKTPKGPRVYHVQAYEDLWVVLLEGEDSPSTAHATKKEATDAGRELARSNEPSRLVIHRADGTVMSEHAYGDGEPDEA